MNSVRRRLEKLELNLLRAKGGIETLTHDELIVSMLDICFAPTLGTKKETRAEAAEPTGEKPEDPMHTRIFEGVTSVLRQIYSAHRQRSQPGYKNYMLEVGEQWRARHSRNDEYVPALLINEHDGFEYPDLMVRRGIVRANPIVMEALQLCDAGPMPSWWEYKDSTVGD